MTIIIGLLVGIEFPVALKLLLKIKTEKNLLALNAWDFSFNKMPVRK